MMCIPTIEDRRMRAHRALAEYRAEVSGDDIKDCMVDLIADLAHYAEYHSIPMEIILYLAQEHYEAECQDE